MQWLEKIDGLYAMADQLLAPYFADGKMERSTSMAEVREELLGSYMAPTFAIDLGASSVRFMPIGTILLGAPGRVDLVGMRGSVRFVLVLPAIDRPMFIRMSLSESEPAPRSSRLWTFRSPIGRFLRIHQVSATARSTGVACSQQSWKLQMATHVVVNLDVPNYAQVVRPQAMGREALALWIPMIPSCRRSKLVVTAQPAVRILTETGRGSVALPAIMKLT